MNIVFAGGGTGGHLYPGLAIAEALGPEAGVVFACSDRAIDARILREAGVRFEVIPAKPSAFRPRGFLRFIRAWGPSVRAARRLIRSRPGSVVVALGGFVAAPVVRAARVEGCPVVLVNLDAVPGRANRMIARSADRIVTAAPETEFGWERIPPIVRAGAIASESQAACRGRLGLAPEARTLLVTGGSQGAKSINDLMIALATGHAGAFKGWQVLHQAGRGEEGPVRAAYVRAGIPHVVLELISRMDLAWGAADLALGRAGAGTVGEVWANRVPSILMPYPYHRDAHQRANAVPLAEAKSGGEPGAMVEIDRVDLAANLGGAGAALLALMGDAARRERMRESLRGLGPADGAARIAGIIREFARRMENASG